MASRLSLVSKKVKVIQGSPGSESGVKLFLMSPLIIWKQSHVQAWPTKGVFQSIFSTMERRIQSSKHKDFQRGKGFHLKSPSISYFCGQIKLNIGEIPSFLRMGFDSLV